MVFGTRCGLIERAVHVHRQVVKIASNWLLLQGEPQLSNSGKTTGQLLVPALQACRLRHMLVLKVHVAQREEPCQWTRARNRVHEEREVARLRQCSLAAVERARCQETADAVVGTLGGHSMLDCPGSSSEDIASLVAGPAVDSTRDAARNITAPAGAQRR